MKKLFLFIFVFIIYFSPNTFASVSSVSEWSVSGSPQLGDVWMCAMLYEPVCWEVETCWVNPSVNWVQNEMCRIEKVQKTFSNYCEANNAFATILYKWECWKNEEPVACTREYIPVCAQPKMSKCKEWMSCIMVMPSPKTYWNDCSARAEWAEILYKWECWKSEEPVACTMEAKMCPDWKTYVWRTWPKCEFEKCPYVLPVKTTKKLDILVQKVLDKATEAEKKWTMKKTEFITKIMDKLIIINNEKPKMTKLVDYIYYKLQDENNTISSSDWISWIMIWWNKDSHGCLTWAGYSWNETKKSCNRSWED